MTNQPLLTLDRPDLAHAYDRLSAARQFESGKRLLHDLAPMTGERAIDVGCGTGLLTEHIADLVGPSGYALGIDPLSLRIAIAKSRARPNLEYRVGDAYALDDLADRSFDIVCLNAVFHWLPEKKGPLASFARILRPGGRLGIGTVVKGYQSRLYALMGEVLSRPPFAGHPGAAARPHFRVDEAEMRTLLEEAGLSVIRLEVQDVRQHFPNAEAAISYAEASSFGNFLGGLPEELRAAAREAMTRALESVATPQGIPRDNRRLIAIATRQ